MRGVCVCGAESWWWCVCVGGWVQPLGNAQQSWGELKDCGTVWAIHLGVCVCVDVVLLMCGAGGNADAEASDAWETGE